MSERVFGIIDESIIGNTQEIIQKLAEYKCASKVYVFTQSDKEFTISDPGCQIETIKVPPEKDSRPKLKNFAIKTLKETGFKGKFHLLEDKIEIKSDPSKFISDVENMMDALNLNNYFGTITDSCNYLYTKYNPRLNVVLDVEKYNKLGFGESVLFCSHSNVQWIVLNLDKADDNELYFDEDFKVDMYWIIEFLARRRNSHPNSLYYMNQYVTCKSEYGVYGFKEGVQSKGIDDIQEVMKVEDGIFKSKCLSYAPDNNVDGVLERLYETLQSKVA